jgi:hypothetical protein
MTEERNKRDRHAQPMSGKTRGSGPGTGTNLGREDDVIQDGRHRPADHGSRGRGGTAPE